MARDPDEDAKAERDVWHEVAKGVSERLMTRAVPNVEAMLSSDRPWEERTVGDVSSLDVLRMGVGLIKAREQARTAVPSMLPAVLLYARIEDHSKWEGVAAQVNASGKIIDAEAEPVPVLPAKDGDEPT